MLFAAGLGTRMGDLVADRPKPLVPVCGRPLIDHALEIASGAGIKNIVANVHYKADMLRAHLIPLGVQVADETEQLLETGGGLRAAAHLLGDGPVFTMNSDAVWSGNNPLTMLAQAWDPDRMDALLAVIPTAKASGHQGSGDFDLDNAVAPMTRGSAFVYTGAQIIKTDELADIPQTAFSLNVLWQRMIENERLFGAVYDGDWCDVGSPQGLATAEKMKVQHSSV